MLAYCGRGLSSVYPVHRALNSTQHNARRWARDRSCWRALPAADNCQTSTRFLRLSVCCCWCCWCKRFSIIATVSLSTQPGHPSVGKQNEYWRRLRPPL